MMELSSQEFALMLLDAADAIADAKNELTEIDSRFGDADHGITMEHIAKKIKEAVKRQKNSTFQSLLDDIAVNIMSVNGGSAVPLWNTFFDGMQSASPDTKTAGPEEIKHLFQGGLEALECLSTARVGDKTMMDALIPAVEAMQSAENQIAPIFLNAASAARKGAKASENFVSKFGRAKNYGRETLGTPDVGAVSAQHFFTGLARRFS